MMHRDHLIEACILLAFKINSGLWEDSSVKACGYSKANILSRVFLFLFRCRTTFGSSFSFSFFSRFWVFRGRRPVHPRLCTYFKHRVFEPFSNLDPIQSPILNAKCGVGQDGALYWTKVGKRFKDSEPFSNLGPIQSPILNAKCGVGQPCKPAE